MQEQIAANVPASSRFLVRASDCEKHGFKEQLNERNLVWWHLYCLLGHTHIIQVGDGKHPLIQLNYQALDILCRNHHPPLDFYQALQKMILIHEAYI